MRAVRNARGDPSGTHSVLHSAPSQQFGRGLRCKIRNLILKKPRLLGLRLFTLDHAFGERHPMTRHIEPGTIVKVNTGGLPVRRGSPAILLRFNGHSVRLLTDAVIAAAVRREITVPRTPMPPFEPMRLRLA